ncbi:MAG TPA: TetR/AcrR family transcriptional regulator [Acidimicrobiales bacterium]|nr:TetR/AcrR family transcriptional regulator [Acidimicrobiales bacterium]
MKAQAAPSRSVERRGRPYPVARAASVERLLGTALELFVAQGYQATTVQQVAAKAGLTKGAIYFYFANKAELLLRLLDKAELLWVESSRRAVMEAGLSAEQQLVQFVHAQSIAGGDHLDHVMLVILMSSEFRGSEGEIAAKLDQMWQAMLQVLSDVVDRGKQQGDFREDLRTREMASYVLAVNQGCFMEWYQRGGRLDGEEFVRTLRGTLLRGLGTIGK